MGRPVSPDRTRNQTQREEHDGHDHPPHQDRRRHQAGGDDPAPRDPDGQAGRGARGDELLRPLGLRADAAVAPAVAGRGHSQAAVAGDKTGAKYYGWAKTGKTDWCASFVSYVYQQAGIPLGPSPHGASGVNGIPHCDNLKRWFQETPGFQWQPKGNGYQPKPGDVVLFDYDGDGHMDHTGIVKSYDPNTGKLTTIEGNVGGDGAAGNGDGTLMERTYDNMKGVAGFGHYEGTVAGGDTAPRNPNVRLPVPV